ncbi:MAG: ABC transporter ATP-binding protein [Polyangiales bacterium]
MDGDAPEPGPRDAMARPDTEPALRCEGVVKRYGDLTAVRDVDLEVEPGEIFALLGPNGAGKTTLIHCITGLARHSEGRITVFGHEVPRDYRTTRRLVGLVPQEINFDPFFTPLESLMIQMGLMGVRPDRRWAEQLLATFALSEKANAYTRYLSGGMKRRLLVAKALVHKPRLLFLDEPTAGVDVELRQDLWREVRRLRDQGTTVILTTHYLEEAEQLADRVGVIHRGRLLLVEDRDGLMHRHRHTSVTLILDTPLSQLPDGLPAGAELDGDRRVQIPCKSPDDLEQALHTVKQHAVIHDVSFEQTTLEDIFVGLITAADRGEE